MNIVRPRSPDGLPLSKLATSERLSFSLAHPFALALFGMHERHGDRAVEWALMKTRTQCGSGRGVSNEIIKQKSMRRRAMLVSLRQFKPFGR